MNSEIVVRVVAGVLFLVVLGVLMYRRRSAKQAS